MSNRQENQELSCPFSPPRVTPTPHFPTAASSGGQGLPETSTGTTIWPCLDAAKPPQREQTKQCYRQPHHTLAPATES